MQWFLVLQLLVMSMRVTRCDFHAATLSELIRSADDEIMVNSDHEKAVEKYSYILDNFQDQLEHPQVIEFNLANSYVELKDYALALKLLKGIESSSFELAKQLDLCKSTALCYCGMQLYVNASNCYRKCLHLNSLTPTGEAENIYEMIQLANNLGNSLINIKTTEAYHEASGVFRQLHTIISRLNAVKSECELYAKSIANLEIISFLLTDMKNGEKYQRMLLEHLTASKMIHEDQVSLHMYIGFLLEQAFPSAAIQHLESCISLLFYQSQSQQVKAHPIKVRSIVYHLGRLYHDANQFGKEDELYSVAVKNSVWNNKMQRPGYFIESIISKPIWKFSDGAFCCQDIFLSNTIEYLEEHSDAIRNEFLNNFFTPFILHKNRQNKSFLLLHDEENIVDQSQWFLMPFVRDNIRYQKQFDDFPYTAAIIDTIFNSSYNVAKGSVEFSILKPGAHLKSHVGPSNHRLRLHLGLLVPPPDICRPRIQVADTTTRWIENKVLLLDDSFEHEVWNEVVASEQQMEEATFKGYRGILMVDVWHPEIDSYSKRDILQHFTSIRST